VNYLLDQQIAALEAQFVEGGGYSEQLAANPQISYGGVGTNITANFCGRFIDSPPLFPL
jgi:hypothetical protein